MDDAELLAHLERAADLWSDFPVEAKPRPLVLTGPIFHGAGFESSEAKNAFGEGRVEVASGVPEGAVRSLRAAGAALRGGEKALRLRHAERCTYAFATDRGQRELDAWRLEIFDTSGPTYVLDADVLASAWLPPGQRADRFRGGPNKAKLEDDGRVVYQFFGSPRRYANYPRVLLIERRAVVAVLPVAVAHRDFRIRFLDAATREVEFRLGEPLGDRVLVGVGGVPVTVER